MTNTPAHQRAREIVQPLYDYDLLIEGSGIANEITAALEEVEAEARESAFLEAIEIVMQSKDVESVLTLLRSKAGGPKLKVAPRSKP